MASATNNNKPFHSYENVGYDDQQTTSIATATAIATNNNISYATPMSSSSLSSMTTAASPTKISAIAIPPQQAQAQAQAQAQPPPPTTTTIPVTLTSTTTINGNINNCNNGFAQTAIASAALPSCGASIAVNKAAIELPFPDPMLSSGGDSSSIMPATAKILSTNDSTGTTCMLTSSSASSRSGTSGQTLVTKLITFPPQSPMDSLKEWSLSTFKCTKQLINEKRGLCPITNDSHLQNDIEQLRENRDKLAQMLRFGQQMTSHYCQLIRTQKQLHSLMNEMSIKCFTNNLVTNTGHSANFKHSGSKQVVANFSSLSNNLSSSTTTTQSPAPNLHHHRHQHHHSNSIEHFEDFLPVLNHMKTSNDTNLVEDFKKNAITLNVAIKNGEKLITALNFYCNNLSTMINKTIEDTLTTVKQYESARLEYDAEKNSLNFISPTAQTSMTYSSDKVELARMRYEQLKEDVQIKMRFLEENTIKVMHKQLLLFNGAFASYTAGNTAALDSTLKQFSIKDGC